MAELLVISGIGLIGNLAVNGGSAILVAGTLYKFRTSLFKMFFLRYRVNKAKKKIKKSINYEKLNYIEFRNGMDLLKTIDRKYDTEYYYNILKKLGLTEDIIDDMILFKMKFDPEFLKTQYDMLLNNNTMNINSDVNIHEMDFFNSKRDKINSIIKDTENRYNIERINSLEKACVEEDVTKLKQSLEEKNKQIENILIKIYKN